LFVDEFYVVEREIMNMRNVILLLSASIFMPITATKKKVYSITHNNQTHDVNELDAHIGILGDSTWVKLVCIKKGMIGMPNIAMPSYRGQYINAQGERCYVFVAEPEGTITYNNRSLNVYRSDGDTGFLSNGTKVRIECLAPGAIAKIVVTPEYRGTYYTNDASGDKNKRQQCHVYAIEPIASQVQDRGTGLRPALSKLGGLGTGFRNTP
jgi:hypothetical protein